jgi:glycerol kinase
VTLSPLSRNASVSSATLLKTAYPPAPALPVSTRLAASKSHNNSLLIIIGHKQFVTKFSPRPWPDPQSTARLCHDHAMALLVIDVGSSSVRASLVGEDGSVTTVGQVPVETRRPLPGFVEIDPVALASSALELARSAASRTQVAAVAITNQRATTVVWERSNGRPIGPALSWQDIRTVGLCLELRGLGFRIAPNESATKLAALIEIFDPNRTMDLCFGTLDTWIAWQLSEGRLHVTDPSNAALTGMLLPDASDWDDEVLKALRIPRSALPQIVDSSGVVGYASALPGTPPIAALIGDQQASLVGQGGFRRLVAKATFGTAGIIDICVGDQRPSFERRGSRGTFPIVAWRREGSLAWGVEGVMLAAGAVLDYLAAEVGLFAHAAQSEQLAAKDSGGVFFVPAVSGMATPEWDLGARGVVVGLRPSTTKEEIIRAAIEGLAHTAADILEAVETDAGRAAQALRVDGGMSQNTTFIRLLADAIGRPVEVSCQVEATTLGAGFLAGLAVGTWRPQAEEESFFKPRWVADPAGRLDRDRWRQAKARARAVVPELSVLEF